MGCLQAGLPQDAEAALIHVALRPACHYTIKVTRPETAGRKALAQLCRQSQAAVHMRVHLHGENEGEETHSGPVFLRMPYNPAKHDKAFETVMPALGALTSLDIVVEDGI